MEHFKIHDLTEHLYILPAILKWCKKLKTVDLPEINLYEGHTEELMEDLDLEADVYRKNFLLPVLYILKSQEQGTNIRKVTIEDISSQRMKNVWHDFRLDFHFEDPLEVVLDTINNTAPCVQVIILNKTYLTYLL